MAAASSGKSKGSSGYTSSLNSSVGGSSSSCRRKGQKKNPSVAPANTSKADMASSKITNSSQEMVYQTDTHLRVKSYVRRRDVLFRRVFDLDIQCGTISLLLQINDDIAEVLYYSNNKCEEALSKLLTKERLNVAAVSKVLLKERELQRELNRGNKKENKRGGDSFKAKKSKKRKRVGDAGDGYDDDESEDFHLFKWQKEKAQVKKRAEFYKRRDEGDYLDDIEERNKVFKRSKKELIDKIKEADVVCGTRSLLVILNTDHDATYYQGDPALVTKFFTTGLSTRMMSKKYNIRIFELDELEHGTCSVPGCAVTRNIMSRARLAAIDLYAWPTSLPVNLHITDGPEKDRWAAELDLDPTPKEGQPADRPIAVCSLHFRDGKPTEENPLPTELLKPSDLQKGLDPSDPIPKFRGKPPPLTTPGGVATDLLVSSDESEMDEADESVTYTKLVSLKRPAEATKSKRAKRLKRAKKKKRKFDPAANQPKNSKQLAKSVQIISLKRQKQRVLKLRKVLSYQSQYSSDKFPNCKSFFNHVRTSQFNLAKQVKSETKSVNKVSTETNSDDNSDQGPMPTKPLGKTELLESEIADLLPLLYPPFTSTPMNPKKKYVCAVCKEVCNIHSLFNHMKEVHSGLLCQYCLKLFKKVPDLENHLKKVHNIHNVYFNNPKQVEKFSGDNYTCVCANCNQFVTFKQMTSGKGCEKCVAASKEVGTGGGAAEKAKEFECPYCGRVFKEQVQLEMHLCNGWCKELKRKTFQSTDRDWATSGKLFKLLSGKELSSVINNNTKSYGRKDQFLNLANIFQFLKHSERRLAELAKNSQKKKFTLSHLPLEGTVYPGRAARGLTVQQKKELKEESGMLPFLRAFDKKVKKSTELDSRTRTTQVLTLEGNIFVVDDPDFAGPRWHQQQQVPGPVRKVPKIRIPIPKYLPKSPPMAMPMSAPPTHPISASGDNNKENDSHAVSLHKTPSGVGTTIKLKISPKGTAELQAKKLNNPVFTPPSRPRLSRSERVAKLQTEIDEGFQKLRTALSRYSADCLVCLQAKDIQVDAPFLYTHLKSCQVANAAGSDPSLASILGESADDCIHRIKSYLRDSRQTELLFDFGQGQTSCEDVVSNGYACCHCRVVTRGTYADFLAHLDTAHNAKVPTCQLCQNIFLNYGSFKSHVCYGLGTAHKGSKFSFRGQYLQTFIEFQHHVRKTHNVCEICFQACRDQDSLHQHCSGHSQETMCMKCFLQFDGVEQFRKHLYFKHEGEHQLCGTCKRKTWRHVYHFCLSDGGSLSNVCEVCDRSFQTLKKYRVHFRTHTGSNPYTCPAESCTKSYVSKPMLLKHQVRRRCGPHAEARAELERRRDGREALKYGASSVQVVRMVQSILNQLAKDAVPEDPEPEPEPVPSDDDIDIKDEFKGGDEESKAEEEEVKDSSKSKTPSPEVPADDLGESAPVAPVKEPDPAPKAEEYDPLAAAIESIMGEEGQVKSKSPVKPLLSPPHQLGPISGPHSSSRSALLSNPTYQRLQEIAQRQSGGGSLLTKPAAPMGVMGSSQTAHSAAKPVTAAGNSLLAKRPPPSFDDVLKLCNSTSPPSGQISRHTTPSHTPPHPPPSPTPTSQLGETAKKLPGEDKAVVKSQQGGSQAAETDLSKLQPVKPKQPKPVILPPTSKSLRDLTLGLDSILEIVDSATVVKQSFTLKTNQVQPPKKVETPAPSESEDEQQPVEPEDLNPLMGDSLWNQDLLFAEEKKPAAPQHTPQPPPPAMVKKKPGGCKVLKPKYPAHHHLGGPPPVPKTKGLKVMPSTIKKSADGTTSVVNSKKGWDLDLSESSDEEGGGEADDWVEFKPKQVKIKERVVKIIDHRFGGIKDHDYCSEAYEISQKEPQSPEELKEEKEEKAKEEEVEPELSEMDKILSDVAMGSANLEVKASPKEDPNAANSGSGKKKKKKKDKKKKKKRHREGPDDDEEERDSKVKLPRGPKPKYHTGTSTGAVAASAARPHFSSSEDDDDADSDVNVDGDGDVEVGGGGGGGDAKGEGDAAGNEEGGDVSDVSSSAIGMESSDFDTDFEADEIIRLKNNPVVAPPPKEIQKVVTDSVRTKRTIKLSSRALAARASTEDSDSESSDSRPPKPPPSKPDSTPAATPTGLKLKIKLKTPGTAPASTPNSATPNFAAAAATAPVNKHLSKIKLKPVKRLSLDGGGRSPSQGASHTAPPVGSSPESHSFFNFGASPKLAKRPSPRKKDSGPKLNDPTLSKKMRESLALNQPAESDEDSSSSSEGDYDSDSSEDGGGGRPAPKKARRHSLPPPPQSMTVYDYGSSGVGGSSEADTKLYCYCQSPHDDVSEMIGCDAPGCKLEWFHFECVGIMIPPEGEWFCPDCAKKYKIK